MKTLRFDRDKARQHYIKQYPDLDVRRLDLLLFRSELLSLNKLFVQEYEQLNKNDKQANSAFAERWHFSPFNYLSLPAIPASYEPFDPVLISVAKLKIDPKYYEGTCIDIRVDLKFPNKQILNEVEKIISSVRAEMEDALNEKSVVEPIGKPKLNLRDCQESLKVWVQVERNVLSTGKKGWAQVKKQFAS